MRIRSKSSPNVSSWDVQSLRDTLRKAATLVIVVSIFLPLAGTNSLFADEPDLMQTIIADDATLNNNLTPIQPLWSRNSEGRQLSLGFGFEKQLSEQLGIEVDGEWDSSSPRHSHADSGIGNVDIELKYVFLKIAKPQFQFALIPRASIPTGSRFDGESMPARFGGAVSWGGRLSNLAHAGWPAVGALEIQGDAGFLHTTGSRGGDEFYLDPVFDYSLPYLAYANEVSLPKPLTGLCPFIEGNFDHVVSGNNAGENKVFVTPGMAWLGDTFQVSAGIQLPVNHEAYSDQHLAIVGSVMIFLDQIAPAFAWQPLRQFE